MGVVASLLRCVHSHTLSYLSQCYLSQSSIFYKVTRFLFKPILKITTTPWKTKPEQIVYGTGVLLHLNKSLLNTCQKFIGSEKLHHSLKSIWEIMARRRQRNSSSAGSTSSNRGGIGFTKLFRGVFVRLFFFLHSALYTWRVVTVSKEELYWALLGVMQILLLIEAFVTLKWHKSGEWKWYVYYSFNLLSIWIGV